MKKYIEIPYGQSVHGKEEINAVIKTLKTPHKWVKMYMNLKKIAKLFDKKYGLMVNSGSSALLLAMEVWLSQKVVRLLHLP